MIGITAIEGSYYNVVGFPAHEVYTNLIQNGRAPFVMKKAYFQMHLAILLWGFTGILGKAIGLSEGMIVWYRMIISAIGLLPVLLSSKPVLPAGRDLLNISITGLIVALHWVFFYASIKASNVSIALSCFSSVSLFTAILEPLSRRQRPKMAEILLGIMVMVGLYIIFSAQQLLFRNSAGCNQCIFRGHIHDFKQNSDKPL